MSSSIEHHGESWFAAATQESESKVTEDLYFLDEDWPKRPPQEVLDDWLAKLEIIVDDAERHFAVKSSQADR